ncbi:MAG: secondary thiamine-phosphate synthase enzyme YjbQ [Propionicimonas sp.]|nr:secondary thiamine-phosphate synthase enzyme YjbQ [Propionicimonas sp.]
MTTHRSTLGISSAGGRPSFHKITDQVKTAVAASGVRQGLCVVSTHHTTCSVMIQEDSIDLTYNGLEFLQQDLWDILEELIPPTRAEGQYRHPGPELTEFSRLHGESKPETLNTDGHLRSAFFGRSETIPVVDQDLDLGRFAHVYFVDFDQTRPRDREVSVTVMGD